ncbi:MAG: peptidylprolyl isomerase, partial [Acetobacteraceae bacterium]
MSETEAPAGDGENTLLMEIEHGTVTIRLRPDLAPLHVERIKTLARQGFYDNVPFHRVIEGFMAQGGDPT